MINILTDINSVPGSGGTIPVSVIYENAAVDDIQAAHTDYSWITVEATGIYPPTGTQDHTISYDITIDPNTDDYREGSVVFRYTDASANSYTAYMFIYQGTSTVINTSIYKDTFFEVYGSSVIYSIVHNGETIFNGKTFRNPDDPITYINVAKIARDYIYQSIGDFREYDDDVIANEGGSGMFSLVNEYGAALASYEFLYQYDSDWSGETEYSMSEPVNGHIDPRMKAMFTIYSSGETTYDYAIKRDSHLILHPHSLTFQGYGGVKTVYIETDDEWTMTSIPSWLSSDITAGTGNTEITLVAEINTDDVNGRSGSVEFTFSDGATVLTVSQLKGSDQLKEYLTFNITSPGYINWTGRGNGWFSRTIYYNKNGEGWNSITSTTAGTKIDVTTGDVVKFRGDYERYFYNGYSASTFSGTTAGFTLSGNIMSLHHSSNFNTDITLTSANTNIFTCLFESCTGLTDASLLQLPATTMASSAYTRMFTHCKSLVKIPEVLPATNLSNVSECYEGMFNDCTSLTTADIVLPAMEVSFWCYEAMFQGCTSLTTPPQLPAKSLANGSYHYMFRRCTSLRKAPDLLAPTLVSNCYASMFYGCSSLNYIKCLAVGENLRMGTWLYGVSSSGTFVKASDATWDRGESGIPSNWTIINE